MTQHKDDCSIKDKLCSVKYNDLDYGVRVCLKVKSEQEKFFDHCDNQTLHTYKNNRPIYLGKTDILSALCLVPLSKDSWSWVIMKADNPATGKTYYFVEKCLPFG